MSPERGLLGVQDLHKPDQGLGVPGAGNQEALNQQSQIELLQSREIRAVGILAPRFTYEHIEDIPAGVDPTQLDFLRDASNVGAFMRIKLLTAKFIFEYFTTNATYSDLAKQYHVTGEAVRQRIARGMAKLHQTLYQKRPSLAGENTYPLEQIQKGKTEAEVFKTHKSRERRSQAQKQRS